MRTLLATLLILAPGLSQAAPVENPGPWQTRVTQPACQNLMDIDNIWIAHTNQDVEKKRRLWARFSNPDSENDDRLCIRLQKGLTVTAVKRVGIYECVEIKGRPARHCFWAKNITPSQQRPFPDADWYAWW